MTLGSLVVTFPVSKRTRDVSLRRAVANCRRALIGEAPLHLVRNQERMR
jgi:hypothetical protein